MKNSSNRKQSLRSISVRHFMTALATGICFTVTSHAVVADFQINSLVAQAIQTHPLVGSARASQQATTEGTRQS